MKRFIPFVKARPAVAVVRLHGMIVSGGRAPGLNDANVAPLIERAFRRGRPRAVALVINSPGGSPTQSSLIAARIRRLAKERQVPVFAFIEDVAASGGYWLATAADEIWADDNSIVGSIGVISAGFGFSDFIERHGVERRVYTSGRSKSMLDPFRPEKPDDVARLRELQEQIHESFIAQVRDRRGSKLQEDDELFTGQIWVGGGALSKGLIDAIGHLVPTMKEKYGEDVRFRVYERRRGLFGRLGMTLTEALAGAVEERASYARFGL
ncbi:S49 family peptidase [Roseitranquillus sediminis]|uniref:S49 family peptidase n=1 Tax=Roseitranquillus sediminis TaxID=2809051 RepID=UPI001D0C8E45|nr:S49 family peptidase [Roseitranquillus sediminis]MBM9593360.1 S49 family peptidase [Roseitranquillus sediminis]